MVDQKFAIFVVAISSVVLISGADTALAGPGDGLKAGELRLHPRMTLSGGYDSNLYRLADKEVDGSVSSAPLLNISPGLAVETIDPTNFKFDFDGELTWEQYFGSDARVRSQSGLAGKANMGGTINPGGKVSFELKEDFSYQNNPPNSRSGVTYDQLSNRVGGVLGFRPGAQIFQLQLGYGYQIYRYLIDNLDDLNRDAHELDLDLTWRFLPKTAFVLENDFTLIRYETDIRGNPPEDAGDQRLRNVDSSPLHIKGGLSGLLTPRITLRLLGGWAGGFYERGPSYQGFIAHTSLNYQIGQKQLDSKVSTGYERRFADAPITNFRAEHRVFLNYTHNFFDKKFGYTLKGAYKHADYADLDVGETQVTRDGETRSFKTVQSSSGNRVFLPDDIEDQIVTARAAVHSELDWWRGELSYKFSSNLSGDRIDIPVQDVTRFREFTRHAILASMTFKY